MKKIVALLLILFSCVSLNAYARSGGSLDISTSATEEYTPNAVEITFTVETKDKNAGVAAENNKKIANEAVEIIKKELNTSKGDTIKTRGYNVSPHYYYKDGKSIFEYYQVTNTFVVKLKDINKIGDIVNLALKNGVNEVSNLAFSLENSESYCTELMSKAAKSARTRANAIAKSMENRIVGVQNVSVSCSNENNYRSVPYRNYYMSAKADMAADESMGAGVPIEAGVLKINASFRGTFIMK